MLNWKHLNDILFFTSVQLHYTMWMSDRWQKLCCFCCVCIFQENVSYISTAIVNAYSNFVFSRHTYYKVHCINLFTNIVACKSTYIYICLDVVIYSARFRHLPKKEKKTEKNQIRPRKRRKNHHLSINILSEIRKMNDRTSDLCSFQSLLISSITSATKRFFGIQLQIALYGSPFVIIPFVHFFSLFCFVLLLKSFVYISSEFEMWTINEIYNRISIGVHKCV